jgi:hypothetical protein
MPSDTPFAFLCGLHNVLADPLAITKTSATEGFNKDFSIIKVNPTEYPVICIIFSAKSFIDHATRVFLVQLLNGSNKVNNR